MDKRHRNVGFTLIELLIAMVVASIVMAAIYATYVSQVRGKNMQEMMTEMQQGVRTALLMMEKDIRMAGCDPIIEDNLKPGIITAAPAELEFTMDFLGDGTTGNQADGMINDAEEHIRYNLSNDADGDGIADSTPCHLWRRRGDQTLPICQNIDALNFVYLNEDGVVLDPVGNPEHRDRIRSIEVTVVARSGERLPGLVMTSEDNTVYRNQRGDVILPAQGDNFIRLVFSTTIKARNLGLLEE